MAEHIANAEVAIDAAPDRVWQALTDPELVKGYLMGSIVSTDWQPGSPITWRGEWEGKPYEDKGEVVAAEPGSRLVVTHFSPLTGQDDIPENYHRLTYDLVPDGDGTKLTLAQDNNASAEEAKQNSDNWGQILLGVKRAAEGG